VKYLLRTGVDPRGVATLLETLLAEERAEGAGDVNRLETLFSTHPLTESRIRDVQRAIDRLEPETAPELELELDAFPIFRTLVSAAGTFDHPPPGF
jgi:predicted Zn-dependent protease